MCMIGMQNSSVVSVCVVCDAGCGMWNVGVWWIDGGVTVVWCATMLMMLVMVIQMGIRRF